MWGFIDCTRYYQSFGVTKIVLDRASLVVGTREKLGLLVPQGEGKSTIMKLLSGVDQPDEGQVLRDKGGWPLGYAGFFRADMTAEDNILILAAMVGVDPVSFSAFCLEFSELGDAFYHPLNSYTGRMRGQLAFAASLGVPASTYLADERLGSGDRPFQEKCAVALEERLKTTGLILVASRPRLTEQVCETHAIVSRGKIIRCASHEEARELFELSNVRGAAEEVADDELASFDLA